MKRELVGIPARPGAAEPQPLAIRRGADLVYIVEDLRLRLFVLTLALLALTSVWSVWTRVEDATRGQLALTLIFGAVGLATASLGLLKSRPAYLWLGHSGARQLVPAAAAVLMLVADGPHSAMWWMAFALIVVTALVSSTTLALIAAVASAGAYILGTLLYGAPLIDQGDATNVFGAAQLVVYALVARAVFEAFAAFVLHLHRLQTEIIDAQGRPLRVSNLETPPGHNEPPAGVSPSVARRRGVPRRSLLTSRQLEVALLLRDGLHQHEIAACLSISKRQVERLVEQARARAGAATTSELVAKLVEGKLVPPVADEE